MINSDADTLHFPSMRKKPELPLAQVERAEKTVERELEAANHPQAAEIARERISKLSDVGPWTDAAIPATPTAELITDRTKLVDQVGAAPEATRRGLPSVLRPILTAVGIFALILLLFKSPIILSEIKYATSKPAATPSALQAGSVIPSTPTITIPKINVSAPVNFIPSIDETSVQKGLETGVIHYANTAVPGQNGNVAIFGHSSNDWWEPGNFKFVFVLLDKLAPGDRFTIDYQSKRYTYEVTGSKVVPPTDVAVLNQTPDPEVSLITCTPPGTSINRLVVTAKQVDPAPSGAVAAATPTPTATASGSNLPGSAPSFWNQITKTWDGIVHGIGSLFGAGGKTDGTTPSTSPSAPNQLPAAK